MKLPDWFRIVWWILLLLFLCVLLWYRFSAISSGAAVPADVFLFLVFIAVALAPLFQEVSFFGLKFKQELKDLKTEVRELGMEVRNTIDVRNQFSPTFTLFPTLPADQLEKVAMEVKRRAETKEVASREPDIEFVSTETEFFFRTRYALEQELRRLYRVQSASADVERPVPIGTITRALLGSQQIDRDAAIAAEEIYRITSRVIHGGEIMPAQAKFVYDVSSWLLRDLRAIE
jgi:hypothetical protein